MNQNSTQVNKNNRSSLASSTIETPEMGFFTQSLQEKVSAAADRKRHNPMRLTTQQNLMKTQKNARKRIIHNACQSKHSDPFMLQSLSNSVERINEEAEEAASPKIKIQNSQIRAQVLFDDKTKTKVNLDRFESHLLSSTIKNGKEEDVAQQSVDLKYKTKEIPASREVSLLTPTQGTLASLDKHFWVTLQHSNAKLSKSVAARIKQPSLQIRDEINSYIRPSLYDQVRAQTR